MRDNQPVSGQNFSFDEQELLISFTDLKGQILNVNDAFVRVSGFSKEELLGQPHNIIRHPDMPEEVFRDLWDTLKAGRVWQAAVKNLRKNGDHYWVRAHVSPLRENGETVGYLSVRTALPVAEQEAAERLYVGMRQQELHHQPLTVKLQHGAVLAQDMWSKWRRRTHIGYRGKLFALTLLACVLAGALLLLPMPKLLALAGILVVAFAVASVQWRMVRRPLRDLYRFSNQLAASNFLHAPEDSMMLRQPGVLADILQNLMHIQINVRAVVQDFEISTLKLKGAVGEIAAGNLDLSARTESQASSLQEAAASMEEINSTVKHSTDAVRESSKLAEQAQQIAQAGDLAVHGVAETMSSITEASQKISDIIQLIEGVAFQTNILALNAAVEAARAGESGRGFAVVASEVRALAQRTSTAAHDIRELIELSGERVTAGNQRVQEARKRMQDVLEAVKKVNDLLEEVRTASQEQQIGVSQVTEAVNQIDTITQQNAAMVEALASGAAAMHDSVKEIVVSSHRLYVSEQQESLAALDASELRRMAQTRLLHVEQFDLGKAVAAHSAWKVKLRNAALNHEHLDDKTIMRDDACALGKWVYGEGGHQHGRKPSFETLKDKHRVFHRCAGQVAEVVNSGQADRAQRMLGHGTPFAEATQEVMSAIQALRREIGA